MILFTIADTFLQNNCDQTLIFYCLPFRHFVQEVSEFWYLRGLIMALQDTKYH